MNLVIYIERAIPASLAAGTVILDVYGTDFEVDYKEDRSPVTIADRKSHECITMELLKNGYPLPVLSEEGRDIPYSDRKGWEVFWLVDPLDGTKEFVGRNGDFTVNIALIENERPQAGVIHVPVRDVLYFAARGLGSWRLTNARRRLKGGEPIGLIISMAEKLPLKAGRDGDTTVIAVSRSNFGGKTEEYCASLAEKGRRIRFIRAGSALKFCLVAEGKADLYPRLGTTMEWDTAAGQIIAEEAGASVTVFEAGGPVRYNKKCLENPRFIVRGYGYDENAG
ncbi:MAG: 3'(2'),5'-bisphosphate nucleotidase CysQ [Spirochaetales bacterium]|nr:3'(2'),5'-bisphosphate nucleotidase CysQ [Spirochaetales bacterium]